MFGQLTSAVERPVAPLEQVSLERRLNPPYEKLDSLLGETKVCVTP
jgi:hypothetical protein